MSSTPPPDFASLIQTLWMLFFKHINEIASVIIIIGALVVVPRRLIGYYFRPKLNLTIREKDGEKPLRLLIKNKKGKKTLEKFRLLLGWPPVGGTLILRNLQLDGDEEIALFFRLDTDGKSLRIEPILAPSIDTTPPAQFNALWFPVSFGENHDFELRFFGSNIRGCDAGPKRYRFVAKGADQLELTKRKGWL